MKINLGWFYPDLMNTYGDRGNIIILQKRMIWRDIQVEIKKISIEDKAEIIDECDLFFMGGAQDRQQEIVSYDLMGKKGKMLIDAVNKGIPGLFICGAYQFMGKYYKMADGKKINGLGLFNLYTENSSFENKRLIGNIIIVPNAKIAKGFFVGFENHGGRTYLLDKTQSFATVVNGYGNNGKDKTEGIFFKNAIGTYLHGPILSKNPELADWLIKKALEVKYKKKMNLTNIDDLPAQKAKQTMIKKINPYNLV